MNIALAQINPVVGAFDENRRRIIEAAMDAKSSGAEWMLTPECSVCGYPPKDLLLSKNFIKQCDDSLKLISDESPLPLIIGHPRKDSAGSLFNSASLLKDGEIIHITDKCFLPDYEVFDEPRYFKSGSGPGVIEINGQRVGVVICEDFWAGRESGHLYEKNLFENFDELKIDLLAAMHATPFRMGRPSRQSLLMYEFSNKMNFPIVSAHQIGANDDVIFGGAGGVYFPGTRASLLENFFEGVRVFDVKKPPDIAPFKELSLEEEVLSALAVGIKDYCKKTGHANVLLGLSGGIDSALVAAIAVSALGPESVCCVRLPSRYTSTASNEDAIQIAQNLAIKDLRTIEIDSIHSEIRRVLISKSIDIEGLPDENLQARIRGINLMAISNSENRLLLATGNKSELAVGYSTLYGDMSGAVAVIGDLFKTLVYKCSRALNANPSILNLPCAPFPNRVLERMPSAELRPNQVDEDSLPPYRDLDSVLFELLESDKTIEEISVRTGLDQGIIRDIEKMVKFSEHKRFQAPVVLKVTSRAFGPGRRMPIVQA